MEKDSPEQPAIGNAKSKAAGSPKYYPPLSAVTSPTVSTEDAAYYTNRKAQTLRSWACFDKGPIRPIRINGRLAWMVQDIKDLLTKGDL